MTETHKDTILKIIDKIHLEPQHERVLPYLPIVNMKETRSNKRTIQYENITIISHSGLHKETID